MSSTLILGIILSYFALLMLISYLTSKGANNNSFFIGNKNSPWYLVAFGMIGTSLSGVTFISVPGWVGDSNFSYLQMVLGYLLGYAVVSFLLLPLYYRLNLTSIYTYLKQRFGFWSYKTGAFYFLLSRTIGAAFRLFLVANVLQLAIFKEWGVPYSLTVAITILLIWIYTAKGGIKTIVWTDSLQTLFMLSAVGITIYQISGQMNWSFSELVYQIDHSPLSKTFFFDDWRDGKFFWKQFLSGAFITIVMTGLDQDMMQKNLSCRNLKEAQWNVLSFSTVLVIVNLLFLSLGVLLYMYADQIGLLIPERTDNLYPQLALNGHLGSIALLLFVLGLIAAAYSSADSALTALTTSVCIDMLNINEKAKRDQLRLRKVVHLVMSLILYVVIIIFSLISDESVISSLFKAAGYTYGPLLGLYAFGMFSKRGVKDSWVPLICILSPIITYVLQLNSTSLFNGYEFSFEIIILNGFLAFLGLWMLSIKQKESALLND